MLVAHDIAGSFVGEWLRARDELHFKPFSSAHEAYAVIKEELDEFWESVKANRPDKKELIQIGAMALAALVELDFATPVEDSPETKREENNAKQ